MDFFNSKECEWADMEVLLGGAIVTKIRSIKYKASKDKESLYAAGDQPIAIQSGNRSYEGEIKILKGCLDDLQILLDLVVLLFVEQRGEVVRKH